MIFTVLGAVAELECTLIVEWVKAGLRNAQAKGKRSDVPRKAWMPLRLPAARTEVFLGGYRGALGCW